MAKKPFSHVNPDTNKVWNRDELFKAFQAEQAKNKKVETESGIISWKDQQTNLVKRWELHTQEYNSLVNDLRQATQMTRKMFDKTFA